MNGATTAIACIRSWCRRHNDDHRPSKEATDYASAMPLVHSMTSRHLEHAESRRRIEPNRALGRTELFLFAGPSRRAHPQGVAAIAIFRSGMEASAAVEMCEAMPYDSGGAEKHMGMTRAEAGGARRRLTMKGATFREYLAAFVACAFDRPSDYLTESPGPDLEISRDHDAGWATGWAKALAKGASDPSCWTVEVRLCPQPGELQLEGCAHLDAVAVFGMEHAATLRRLEAWLGETRTELIIEACDGGTEAGLARRHSLADRYGLRALHWSTTRIRRILEESD